MSMQRVNAAFATPLHADSQVFRLDIKTDARSVIERSGLNYQETEELFRFLGRDAIEEDEVVRRVFRPRDGRFGTGRFGDGQHPVLYCAIERETAVAEISHHLQRIGWVGGQCVEFRDVISIDLSGLHADLRERGIPELTEETSSFCLAVGTAAADSEVAFFYCPSARRQEGTNCPVFREGSIKNIVWAGRLRFTADAPGGQIQSQFV